MNDETRLLEIEKSKNPMPYPEAAELATRSAESDSESFRRRSPFRSKGVAIGQPSDNTHLYDFTGEGDKRSAP